MLWFAFVFKVSRYFYKQLLLQNVSTRCTRWMSFYYINSQFTRNSTSCFKFHLMQLYFWIFIIEYGWVDNYFSAFSFLIAFSDLQVVLGQYDLLNFPKDDSIQRYYAKKIHLHPNFTNIFRLRDDGFLESEPTHDVALLLLDRHVSIWVNPTRRGGF